MAQKKAFAHQHVVDAVIEKLKTMKEGVETCTSDLVGMVFPYEAYAGGWYQYKGVQIDTMEFFEIDNQLRKQARKIGIILDSSKYAGLAIGLPFHCPFTIRHRK